jgi:hypothetical protein
MKRWWRRPEERTEEYPWCYIMFHKLPPVAHSDGDQRFL